MEADVQIEQGIMYGGTDSPEHLMLSKERWEEIRRLHEEQGLTVSELGRQLEIDRKTVRKALREEWKPYARTARTDTLLCEHTQYIEARVAEVNYSAQVLYQELKAQRGFKGSYETVKRYVAHCERSVSRIICARLALRPGRASRAKSTGARCGRICAISR